mgnify:CR=1 FL=1
MKRICQAHDRGDSADDDLVETELFVFAGKYSEEQVKVVLEARQYILGLDSLIFRMQLERAQQLHRLDLVRADALDTREHPLHLGDFAFLRLDEVADAVLFLGEVGAPLFDAGAFFRQGAERRGQSRAEEGEVVSEFGEASRIGRAGTERRERGQRLIREL